MSRINVYTVHEKPSAPEPSDRIVVVREGFAIWAFVLHLFWLLAHQCWRMSAIYLVLAVGLDMAGTRLGVSESARWALQLGLQFWLGCNARDMVRASLQRQGYREVGIVCAESSLMAERRFFDRQSSVMA